MKNCAAVIFDMDGCLVDSERVYVQCWKHAFEREKIAPDMEKIRSWAGASTPHIDRDLLEITKDRDMAKTLRRHRETMFLEKVKAGQLCTMPGAEACLIRLREQQIPCYLATSSFRKKASAVLEALQLRKYFAGIVYGDMVKNAKPSPDIYRKVLDLAHCTPQEVLVFEDSYNGVKAARAAGISHIVHVPDPGVVQTVPEEWYWKRLRSLEEVPRLFNENFE